jgi:ribonuclease R
LGERSGKRWRLGDRMWIKVVRVDLETTKIDFAPIEGPADSAEKPKKPRARRVPAKKKEAFNG